MLQAIKNDPQEFSIREARGIVKDLFEPNPVVYWTDLLLTTMVGMAGMQLFRFQPAFSTLQISGYLIACLAFYRSGSFTHELVHLRTGTFRWFRVAWNLLCGIPFLMPSFMYYTHIAHHARNHYGTEEDGEYLPLATGPARNILWYMAQAFVIPILGVLRFLVCVPLAWISPGFRRLLQQRASSLVMDPRYIRPLPSNKELKAWRWQEAACFLYAVGAAIAFSAGVFPLIGLLKLYLIAAGVIALNQIRTLGAHRFRHRGEELTFLEQLLDSVNYPDRPLLTGLWAPVGLRYHALHHLFPSMPYHALDEAHRRLMAQLPDDSPYRETVSPGLLASIRQLWHEARTSDELKPAAGRVHSGAARSQVHQGR